jgi:hypothetical protein
VHMLVCTLSLLVAFHAIALLCANPTRLDRVRGPWREPRATFYIGDDGRERFVRGGRRLQTRDIGSRGKGAGGGDGAGSGERGRVMVCGTELACMWTWWLVICLLFLAEVCYHVPFPFIGLCIM